MVDKATPVAFMCDYEVLEILKGIRKAPRSEAQASLSAADHEGKQRLATVVYEAVKFLETGPSGKQTAEQVEKFMMEVKQFGLSKLEKLQFVNLVPQAPVDLHLLVKDLEQRLSEEQIPKLIELVQDSFPECKRVEQEEEEEEQEEEDEEPVDEDVKEPIDDEDMKEPIDEEDMKEPLPDSDE